MFALTDEQRLLIDSTRRYLAATPPRDAGGERYWRRGAELGWTGLLAHSARAGRFTDLVLLAREFGREVGVGPLGPVNLAVAALTASDADGRRTDEALSSLLEGTDTAAWVDGASSAGGVIARRRSDDVVLDGAVAPVEVAIDAGYLVISCSDSTTYLVPSSTPGVTITALHSLDGSRSYGRVRCERVLIRPDTLLGRGPDPALVSHLRDLAVIIQLGEIVGAMEWAFESTTRWCFDRYSFGQPLAAYQAIQHRLADLAMGLEASRAITADAALAMLGDGFDRTELVSAAKAYVGRVGPDLLQECVQLHGGIGLTADHDLHRYLRRVAADVATHGNVREHAARVGRLVEQRVSA